MFRKEFEEFERKDVQDAIDHPDSGRFLMRKNDQGEYDLLTEAPEGRAHFYTSSHGFHVQGCRFNEFNLQELYLEKIDKLLIFEGCVFDQIKFDDQNIHKIRFERCHFIHSSRFTFKKTIRSDIFSNCIFENVVQINGGGQGEICDFQGCTFKENLEVISVEVNQDFLRRGTFKGTVTFSKCSFTVCEFKLYKCQRIIFIKSIFKNDLNIIQEKQEVEFYDCCFEYSLFSDAVYEQIFVECQFKKDVTFALNSKTKNIKITRKTVFERNVHFKGKKSLNSEILLENVYFGGSVIISSLNDDQMQGMLQDFKKIAIGGCVFSETVYFFRKNVGGGYHLAPMWVLTFICRDNKFSNSVIADHLKVTDFALQYNQFSDVASFAHCRFHSIPEGGFASNSFLSLVNFHQAELPKGFDLSDNLFKEGINFRGVTLTDDPKKHSLNQESCRIIKYSLDKIGNTVEANEYFALEMRNFSHSISLLKNPNKFVIWLSRISSNFGQSWFRPLLLLIGITLFSYSWPYWAYEYQCWDFLGFYLPVMGFLEHLNAISRDFIPFAKYFKLMDSGSGTSIGSLCLLLFQIYLIWQIILASKRQIKR